MRHGRWLCQGLLQADLARASGSSGANRDVVAAVAYLAVVPDDARATHRYPWPRFWTRPGDNIDDGFFADASSILGEGGDAAQLSELLNDPCIVLLGEPGLGKTHAIDDAVAELRRSGNRVHEVALGAYEDGESLIGAIVDSVAWRTWRASDDVLFLFLDALDEALLHVKAIHKRLIIELKGVGEEIARLRLRISCRSAEWLPDFGDQLRDVFSAPDAPRRLALAPLRAADVAAAARAEGLEPERFLNEIEERGLQGLAAFPLTLRMMIDVAASDEGALPRTRSQLFDRAILRLAEEHDAGRRRELTGRALHVGKRVFVAERIAAAMVLAGKAAIDAALAATSGGDLTVRELAGFSEHDPEAAGAASFNVGVEEVQEVLATALFVDLGAGRLTFAHRSLAEYLAARYLAHHHMDADQIMSLLASADDPGGRLIPQLREVAAWTATLDHDVLAEVLDREPELLLRADGLTFGDESRARVVSSLLTEETAMHVDRYDRRIRGAFADLAHPGITDQIRDALRPSHSIPVRQMAFTLAQATAIRELQRDLVAFAFNAEEPAYLRDDAVWSLKDYADAQTRLALVPLATERIDDDVDDEIKGQALAATFPFVLGIADALRALTPPRNEYLMGAYRAFVARDLPQAIQVDDLPVALAWAKSVPRDHGARDLLSSLTDDILAAAWPHLDDEAIRAAVLAVIGPRLSQHHELLGSSHSAGDIRTFREQRGRRLLVADLLDAAAEEIDPRCVYWSRPPLVLDEDYPWVVEQLRHALGGRAEPAWAALAGWMFAPETCDIEEMFELAGMSAAFAARTEQWRTSADVRDGGARISAEPRQEAPPADAPDMDRVIEDCLEAIQDGDLDSWWQLNVALIFGPRGRNNGAREIEADITRLAGWIRADDSVRTRILAAARAYLDYAPPDPDGWIAKDTINRPAFAGYRALLLLARHRPAQLEALDVGTWTRWMPIIVAYPRSSGIDDERFDDVLITVAARRAPDVLVHWISRMIDVQNARGEGHLFVLSRLRHVTVSGLIEALALKLTTPELTAIARADLAEFGMREDAPRFLPSVAKLLTPDAICRDRDAARLIAAAAFARAPAASWLLIENLFVSDPDLGKEVFEKVAYDADADLASELDDGSLHRLLDWLFESFPPASDPPLAPGASFVSPREEAGHRRDRLLSVLAGRGTDEAVAHIDALALKFPSYGMMLRKRDAREARLARWTAPEPRHVIQLAQSNDARIVLSDAHLQQALMASLRRIERRLQESSPPASRELWNTSGAPTPKSEEELSTWLRGRLQEDLVIGGRVIGRELEIRPNKTGRGRGESVDIAVFAPVGADVESATTASVTIEVKGCWHAKVRSAMKSQLVNRYLTGTGTTHGIYVVFWFGAENWLKTDSRRRRCVRDAQRLQDGLVEQARTLTDQAHATVRAFVLNGSLPPATGQPLRIRR